MALVEVFEQRNRIGQWVVGSGSVEIEGSEHVWSELSELAVAGLEQIDVVVVGGMGDPHSAGDRESVADSCELRSPFGQIPMCEDTARRRERLLAPRAYLEVVTPLHTFSHVGITGG